MHWREGFRRLATATAWVYWAIVAIWQVADFENKMVIASNQDLAAPLRVAVSQTAQDVAKCFVFYFGGLLAFRVVRWVGRGFLDGDTAARH